MASCQTGQKIKLFTRKAFREGIWLNSFFYNMRNILTMIATWDFYIFSPFSQMQMNELFIFLKEVFQRQNLV